MNPFKAIKKPKKEGEWGFLILTFMNTEVSKRKPRFYNAYIKKKKYWEDFNSNEKLKVLERYQDTIIGIKRNNTLANTIGFEKELDILKSFTEPEILFLLL